MPDWSSVFDEAYLIAGASAADLGRFVNTVGQPRLIEKGGQLFVGGHTESTFREVVAELEAVGIGLDEL